MKKILIVDDEESIRWVLGKFFEKSGYEVLYAEDCKQALEKATGDLHLILLDIKLPDGSGLEVFRKIRADGIEAPVIVLTAQSMMSSAIEAMKLGAYDYIAKPFDLDEVRVSAEKAIENHRNTQRLQHLRTEINEIEKQDIKQQIIGTSLSMLDIYKKIGRVAEKNFSILITGESGTGKELVARAIHYNSSRRNHKLISINITAMPKELLESELFGYEKGAFTGATHSKTGRFEEAHRGTLLLDEIGGMPPELQTKLLRVLEEKKFYKLGGVEPIEVDIRLLACTNSNLEEEVEKGSFRKDLFYRLNSISIMLPPLRNRREDIPLLVDHFLEKYSFELQESPRVFTDEGMKILVDYAWPGNVRELENTVKRVLVLTTDTLIKPDDLRDAAPYLATKTDKRAGSFDERIKKPVMDYLEEIDVNGRAEIYDVVIKKVEKPLIEGVLKITKGNKKKAAQILGINRNTLSKKISELRITADDHSTE